VRISKLATSGMPERQKLHLRQFLSQRQFLPPIVYDMDNNVRPFARSLLAVWLVRA
jgi:hypothetical protein